MIITTRDFVAGETVGAHIHHGVEMTQVVKGSFEIFIKGQPPKVIKAGESFMVPREAVHDGRPAAGSGPVHVAVTLVIDKGTVPRTHARKPPHAMPCFDPETARCSIISDLTSAMPRPGGERHRAYAFLAHLIVPDQITPFPAGTNRMTRCIDRKCPVVGDQ